MQAALAVIVAFEWKGGVFGILCETKNTHICVCVYPSLLLDTYREQGQALASVTELDQDRGADLSQSLS